MGSEDRFINVLRLRCEGPPGIETLKRIGGFLRESLPQRLIGGQLHESLGECDAVTRRDDPPRASRPHDIRDFPDVSRNHRETEGKRIHQDAALRGLDIGKRYDIGVESGAEQAPDPG